MADASLLTENFLVIASDVRSIRIAPLEHKKNSWKFERGKRRPRPKARGLKNKQIRRLGALCHQINLKFDFSLFQFSISDHDWKHYQHPRTRAPPSGVAAPFREHGAAARGGHAGMGFVTETCSSAACSPTRSTVLSIRQPSFAQII
jgi:hypothetical protein